MVSVLLRRDYFFYYRRAHAYLKRKAQKTETGPPFLFVGHVSKTPARKKRGRVEAKLLQIRTSVRGEPEQGEGAEAEQ